MMPIEIRAARLEERPAICHLIDLAFDAEDYGPSLAHPCPSVGNSHLDPHDRPENTRILLLDGQIVSVVHIAERETYVCGDTAPVGFVAMVATHPDQRRRGHVRRLMQHAEAYMKSRGFCYAALMGAYRTYAGSLGWRLCSEKNPTLAWKYVVSADPPRSAGLSTSAAAAEDIPFLSRLYEERYGRRFGPVVRSPEYWRRWSLRRPEEGTYTVVWDQGERVGYFHMGGAHQDVGEIAWQPRGGFAAEQVFLAASSHAAAQGVPTLAFWIDRADAAGAAALRRAFGHVPPTYVDPMGQPVCDPGPAPFLPPNRPDGTGLLVKFLNPGPGVLSEVASTDGLTDVMARHSWIFFDGDAI